MKHGCTSITADLNTGMHDERELIERGTFKSVEAAQARTKQLSVPSIPAVQAICLADSFA